MTTKEVDFERLDVRRKPNYSHIVRNIDLKRMEEQMMNITINSPTPEIKEILLKLKCTVNYDKNAKTLGICEVGNLQKTLKYLRYLDNEDWVPLNQISVDELLKQGLIYEIMNSMARLLPCNCNKCDKNITYGERIVNRCICFGVTACKDCFSNLLDEQPHVCYNCVGQIQSERRIPQHFIKARSRDNLRIGENEKESNANIGNDENEEEISQNPGTSS